jgi:Ca2+-binding EF-hand superfamily protein
MKALLLPTLACLATGLLPAANSGLGVEVQRGQDEETERGPIERGTRGASAKKNRNRSLSPAVLEEYFRTGDYDSNGMISFREAREALAITRAGFARYDTNRDGLIDSEEFVARYSDALLAGNSLPQPLEAREEPRPPARSAPQLRLAYDANADGRLDVVEVQKALVSYEQEELDSEETLQRLDVDSSGFLELSEIEGLVPLLFAGDAIGIVQRPETADGEPFRAATTVFDLFGEREARESESSAAALPAQIVGPLDHFSRLDSNGDGLISYEDLDSLLRPIQSSIRLRAVVATLDTDEDGVVSREEFWASM